MIERFALLLAITVAWAYAHLLTASGAYKHRPERTQDNCRTDRAHLVSSAAWCGTPPPPAIFSLPRRKKTSSGLLILSHRCRIKIPYPLQWGAPTFDAGHAFGMMAAVLVSLIEVEDDPSFLEQEQEWKLETSRYESSCSFR